MYGPTFFMTLSGMLSLSNSWSISRNLPAFANRFLPAGSTQSRIFLPGLSGSFFFNGATSKKTQATSSVRATPLGGFFRALTSSI